jgi:membrane protein YqaA with SNARE-associated domain
LLLLSWVPVVGDAFCAAAGFLRLPWPACILAMAAGKLARYALIAQAVALA